MPGRQAGGETSYAKMNFRQMYMIYYTLIFNIVVGAGNFAFAQDNLFYRVELPYEISLEIPSHWTILSKEERQNVQAARSAIIDNAGIESPIQGKQSLLVVKAPPDPPGAIIRVSVTTPSELAQSDLAVATIADLREVSSETHKLLMQLEENGGAKIIKMKPVKIEKINGDFALVTSYVRASFNGPSNWDVIQYKIPISNRLIEITLSHRQADAVIWRPILERVKRSVKF